MANRITEYHIGICGTSGSGRFEVYNSVAPFFSQAQFGNS